MRTFTTRMGAALIALLLTTAAAQARVTAKEVWQNVMDYYAGIGQTVTTDGEVMAGETLVVTGAKISGALFDLRVPEMRFRETGDGRVEVTTAERITGSVTGPHDSGDAATTSFEVTQSDLKVVVTGDDGEMDYDFVIPELTIATAETEAAGVPVPVQFAVTMEGGSGTARMSGTTTTVLDSEAQFESMSFDISTMSEKDGAQVSSTSGTLSEVDILSGLQLPHGADLNDMGKALAAGYRVQTQLRFVSGNVNSDVRAADGTTNVQAGLADGRLKMLTAKSGIAYEMRAGASRAVVQVPTLPVPAEIGFDETVLGLSMPVEPGGEAQPFSTEMRIGGLTLSDGVWAMFDPTAALPHDPMTFVLDLSGTMRLMRSFFGESIASEMGKVPAEVELGVFKRTEALRSRRRGRGFRFGADRQWRGAARAGRLS